jgi:putative photosynthetic complex assembly protein 2
MAYVLPIVFAIVLWWASTGFIFYLDGLPVKTFKWSMLGATALLAASLAGLWMSANDTTTLGAYVAFASALVAWGWMEISLYMGYVTGPRKHRCNQGCSGMSHFGHAIAANLWHELAIIAAAAAIVALTWKGTNATGLWTYVVLWWMHLSARLNVFLGVPNVSEEFVPDHMEVLKGFLTRKPMNLLFPVSVTVSTVIAVFLVARAAEAQGGFEITSYVFLSALMVLAIVEHWFLVLPLPSAALWNWSLSSRTPAKPELEATILPSAEIVQFRPQRTAKTG